jgi:RNA polymerase sigma-70 factor (ECF subfamily)
VTVDDTPSAWATQASLLVRLRVAAPDDQTWAEFVRRYGPLILRWCRRWKLQDADAQDVTQTVLVRLAERLRIFEYDPTRSFRAYVRTVTHYVWCDFLESRKRPDAGSGDSVVLEQLDHAAARDDLTARLSAEFDQELLETASVRVRSRLAANTWEAFRLTAVEGLTGAEAAARLGMTVPAVFKARCKVQKLLQEEMRRLEGTEDGR